MAANLVKSSKSCLNEVVKNDIKNYNHKVNSKQKHSIRLMENLKNLLHENLYCDVDLIAGADNTRVSVQRIVLIASSEYFRTMFSSGMSECEKREIPLQDIDGEALRLIIDYCYTGEIEINAENVETLLPAASQLEFVEIEEECSKFLEIFLQKHPLNCLSYYLVAQRYNFAGLKMMAQEIMLKYFMKIKDAEEFLMLDFDALFGLICSDKLNVEREEFIFLAAMKWIKHNENSRRKYLVKVLNVMRFTQMEGTFLTKHVIGTLTSNGLAELCGDVLNVKCNSRFKPQHIAEHLLRPRTVVESGKTSQTKLYAFISDSYMIHKEIYDGSNWKALQSVKIPINEEVYAIVQWQTSLYIFGASKRVVCMDIESSEITSVPDIPTEHINYAVTVHNDNIYVMGGKVKIQKQNEICLIYYDYKPLNAISKYDILNRTWSTSTFLPGEKPGFPATHVNGKICYADQSNNSVQSIDQNLTTRTSASLEKPLNRNTIIQMISNKNQLYVAGSTWIEKYDFATKTWTMVLDFDSKEIIPNKLSNRIFSTETEYSSDEFKRSIEKFCPESNKWFSCGSTSNAYPRTAKIALYDQST